MMNKKIRITLFHFAVLSVVYLYLLTVFVISVVAVVNELI